MIQLSLTSPGVGVAGGVDPQTGEKPHCRGPPTGMRVLSLMAGSPVQRAYIRKKFGFEANRA